MVLLAIGDMMGVCCACKYIFIHSRMSLSECDLQIEDGTPWLRAECLCYLEGFKAYSVVH